MLCTPIATLSDNVGVDCPSTWYALYARHQHEKNVAKILTRKGFKVLLPLCQSIRHWKDRAKVLSLPLFPCYVFVKGGLERRLDILATPGIYALVSSAGRPSPIPPVEIEAIRLAVESGATLEPHPFLKCGERVRVTRGTLEGVEGILVRKKSLYRLVLSVEMLAQSVALEIDASDVEPAAAYAQGHLRQDSSKPCLAQ